MEMIGWRGRVVGLRGGGEIEGDTDVERICWMRVGLVTLIVKWDDTVLDTD